MNVRVVLRVQLVGVKLVSNQSQQIDVDVMPSIEPTKCR